MIFPMNCHHDRSTVTWETGFWAACVLCKIILIKLIDVGETHPWLRSWTGEREQRADEFIFLFPDCSCHEPAASSSCYLSLHLFPWTLTQNKPFSLKLLLSEYFITGTEETMMLCNSCCGVVTCLLLGYCRLMDFSFFCYFFLYLVF